jgi:hypothetical protein
MYNAAGTKIGGGDNVTVGQLYSNKPEGFIAYGIIDNGATVTVSFDIDHTLSRNCISPVYVCKDLGLCLRKSVNKTYAFDNSRPYSSVNCATINHPIGDSTSMAAIVQSVVAFKTYLKEDTAKPKITAIDKHGLTVKGICFDNVRALFDSVIGNGSVSGFYIHGIRSESMPPVFMSIDIKNSSRLRVCLHCDEMGVTLRVGKNDSQLMSKERFLNDETGALIIEHVPGGVNFGLADLVREAINLVPLVRINVVAQEMVGRSRVLVQRDGLRYGSSDPVVADIMGDGKSFKVYHPTTKEMLSFTKDQGLTKSYNAPCFVSADGKIQVVFKKTEFRYVSNTNFYCRDGFSCPSSDIKRLSWLFDQAFAKIEG